MSLIVRFAAFSCLVFVLAGLLLDLAPLESTAPTHADKLVHFVMFACVSLSLTILWPALKAPATALLTILIGGATEGLQALVGRDPSWEDFLADIAGAGLVLTIALVRRRHGSDKPASDG